MQGWRWVYWVRPATTVPRICALRTPWNYADRRLLAYDPVIDESVTTSGPVPAKATGLPARLAAAPLGVVRPVDLSDVYAHPRAEVARLERRGLLHRLLPGYYAVVPPGRTDRSWVPSLEAAAAGLGTAAFGPGRAVLMGLTAARLHGAIPRALAVAVVAVPRQHGPMSLTDRPARVIFVRRNVDRLDAERMPTDLGPALVTGVEQSVLDLAHRPDLGGVPDEARAAVRALLARSDADLLDRLAEEQRLGAARERALTWTR